MAQKKFYLVKNLTSGEVNSPQVNVVTGTLGADNYSLIKKAIDAPEPTGENVVQYVFTEDYKAALSLEMFTPVCETIRPYKVYDKEYCSNLILQFQSDIGSLTITETNTLLALLGGVLQLLNVNSPHHAQTVLAGITPTALFPQSLKDKYLNLLDEYLKMYPRI